MKGQLMNDWRLVFALSGLVAVACGSSGGPAGDGTEIMAPAACVANKLTLVGELDDQPVDLQIDLTSSLFQQVHVPYSTDLGYVGGSAHVQWNTMIISDRPAVAATGTVVMPPGAPHAGETICGGKGTIEGTDPAGTGFKINQIFTLGTLTVGPTCPGPVLAGSIKGCVGE
jgi:hypothetical protein